jgi:hypothetical protein
LKSAGIIAVLIPAAAEPWPSGTSRTESAAAHLFKPRSCVLAHRSKFAGLRR